MPSHDDIATPVILEDTTLYVAIELSGKSWVVGVKAPGSGAEASLADLMAHGVKAWEIVEIEGCIAHAQRQIDQVERRLLRGETIPQDEKVFSIFEPHTRWISKGKAGCPVELGVPVCILEERHGFVLHHEVMWEGSDVDHGVPMVENAQARFPDLRAVSFDRGFHSPGNRVRLDELLDHNVLPKKGYLNSPAPGARQNVVDGSLTDPAGQGNLRHRQLMVESKLQDGSDSLHIGSPHGSGSSSGVESGRGLCPEPMRENHRIAGQRPDDTKGSFDHETGSREPWRRRSSAVGICITRNRRVRMVRKSRFPPRFSKTY